MIKTLLRAGGYSHVLKKVPLKNIPAKKILLPDKKDKKAKNGKRKILKTLEYTQGLLVASDGCIRLIQRQWIKYRGKLALDLKFEIRAVQMNKEKLLLKMIITIQSSYRAHLWNVLMLAAVQNNRAKRIQKCSRAYQYRSWIWNSIEFKKMRKMKKRKRMIETFLIFVIFRLRVKKKKELAIIVSEDRDYRTVLIQRAYRDTIARRIIRRRLELKAFRKLRETSASVRSCVSAIQRNW